MSKNKITKDEIQCYILKLKNDLYQEQLSEYTSDPKQIANKYLNKVLDKVQEFRYD
jgi:hypothetical protein